MRRRKITNIRERSVRAKAKMERNIAKNTVVSTNSRLLDLLRPVDSRRSRRKKNALPSNTLGFSLEGVADSAEFSGKSTPVLLRTQPQI